MINSNEMMVTFENNEFGKLDILTIDGKSYFPAIKCAKILGYSNPRDAVLRHCKEDGVVRHDVASVTTNQYGKSTEQIVEAKYISEGNLYRLIVRSKIPTAEKFEKWVFDEALPTLRKKGSYSMNGQQMEIPKDYPSALRALADQVESNLALVEQNAALTSQNKILAGEILRWDSPALLNAIIRKYGHVVCGDKFGCAWKAFYKELLYKHSINLESRKTNDVNKNPKNQNKAIYKYLAAEEWQSAIETAVALCSAADVDISDILKANIEETAIVA